MLVAATIVSSWQAWRATQAEKPANRKTADEKVAREDAEAISTFLTRVFQSPDPERDGRTITVAEVLSKASRELNAVAVEEDDDSEVRRYSIPGKLGAGPHVLAISVHNSSPSSTDLRLGGVTLVGTAAPANTR